MSIADNKALIRRLYEEVINEGNLDMIDDLVSQGFVEHEAVPGVTATGPAAPKETFKMFITAFPDLNITPHEMIGEGDKVVVRGTISGTHKGEFMGMPPTNKTFEAQIIDILEIHDGKLTAHWGMTDQAAIMEQLGLAPPM